jgi:carbon storage regulator
MCTPECAEKGAAFDEWCRRKLEQQRPSIWTRLFRFLVGNFRANDPDYYYKRDTTMLILTRKPVETLDITLEDGRRIEVSVLGVAGNQVRLGVNAPKTIIVDRHEVTKRKWIESHGVTSNV